MNYKLKEAIRRKYGEYINTYKNIANYAIEWGIDEIELANIVGELKKEIPEPFLVNIQNAYRDIKRSN